MLGLFDEKIFKITSKENQQITKTTIFVH